MRDDHRIEQPHLPTLLAELNADINSGRKWLAEYRSKHLVEQDLAHEADVRAEMKKQLRENCDLEDELDALATSLGHYTPTGHELTPRSLWPFPEV